MSTHSLIGKENPDHTYIYISCHWDGYPSHNGSILLEHYNTPEKVDALISLGNLSSLGEEIGEKHDFDYAGDLKAISLDKMCTAYHRDRGEDWEDVKPKTREEWDMEEYNYRFRLNGTWEVSVDGKPWRKLTLGACMKRIPAMQK